VLQTFDRNSLKLLHEAMPQVPKVLLLWVGNTGIASASGQDFAQSGERDKAAFHARQQPKDKAEFLRWLDDAKQEGAIGTGPSATHTHLGEQSYGDLIQPWMNQANHQRGLLEHVYTLDDRVDLTRPCSLVSTGSSPTGRESCCALNQRPTENEGALLKHLGY